ncbi:MAG: LiaI-LiaF-like domain-containing protein, partial [Terriglobales bacterium]
MPPPDLQTGPEARCRRPLHPEVAIAWIVLMVGILAMATNLGVISTALWRLWPLCIVAAGLVQYSK